jgi:3-dehydroquinate synthetase
MAIHSFAAIGGKATIHTRANRSNLDSTKKCVANFKKPDVVDWETQFHATLPTSPMVQVYFLFFQHECYKFQLMQTFKY